jgi:hypothetical protein
MKKILIILISVLILFAGCSTIDESDYDLTKLDEKIDEAELAMEGVTTADSESEVARDRKWVTKDEMNAFTTAIAAAKKTRGSATSKSTVNNAVNALDTAIIKFKPQIKIGTKESGFTKTELNALITEAENAKAKVQTSINGADVSKEKYWVTPFIMDYLTSAITEAQKANWTYDTEYIRLLTALNYFYLNKIKGTAITHSITINDLSQHDFSNGTDIEVGLFKNNNLNFNIKPEISGNGSINNEKVTIVLYISSGKNYVLWTGNGLYYVGLKYGERTYISKEKVNFSDKNPNPAISYYNFEEVNSGLVTEQRKIIIMGLGSFAGEDIENGI